MRANVFVSPLLMPKYPATLKNHCGASSLWNVDADRPVVGRVDLEVVVVRPVEGHHQVVQDLGAQDERIVGRDHRVLPGPAEGARQDVAVREVGRRGRARHPHPPVRAVLVAERVIDPAQILVVVVLRRLFEQEPHRIVAGRAVGEREVLVDNPHRWRAELRRRDLVVRVRLVRERVPELPRDGREVAVAHGRRRNERRPRRRTLLLLCPLVGPEEERTILRDGSAEGAAVLLPLQAIVHAGREEVGGVDLVMTEVPEPEAAELVGAGAGHRVDHRPHVPAVFGAEAVGLDAELLQRVGVRHRVGCVVVVVVVRSAVEHVVDRVAARAARRDGLHARIRRAREQVAAVGQHPGHELEQVRRIAPVERQLLEPFLIDDGLQGARHRVDRARLTGHGEGLGDRADLEPDVQAHLVVHADEHARMLERPEPVPLGDDRVAADGQPRQRVDAEVVAHGRGPGVGALVCGRDGRAGNERAT